MSSHQAIQPGDIRQRVARDAADLIALIGIADPLIEADLGRNDRVARFLRKVLTKNVILVLTNLHAKAGSGSTGETASIDALIDFQGRLSDEKVAHFKAERQRLIDELAYRGIPYEDLRRFRNAEIAHSLQRLDTSTDAKLVASAIWEFAHDTYELVIAIEAELTASGATAFSDLPNLFHDWKDWGLEFWQDRLD